MKIALVVLAAVLSVVLSEAGLIGWLLMSGRWLDVTGSLWLLGILPVVLVVVVLQTLALWRIYRAAPLRFGLIYGVAFAVLHGLALSAMGNPASVVTLYVLNDLALAALVIGGCHLLFWRNPPPP